MSLRTNKRRYLSKLYKETFKPQQNQEFEKIEFDNGNVFKKMKDIKNRNDKHENAEVQATNLIKCGNSFNTEKFFSIKNEYLEEISSKIAKDRKKRRRSLTKSIDFSIVKHLRSAFSMAKNKYVHTIYEDSNDEPDPFEIAPIQMRLKQEDYKPSRFKSNAKESSDSLSRSLLSPRKTQEMRLISQLSSPRTLHSYNPSATITKNFRLNSLIPKDLARVVLPPESLSSMPYFNPSTGGVDMDKLVKFKSRQHLKRLQKKLERDFKKEEGNKARKSNSKWARMSSLTRRSTKRKTVLLEQFSQSPTKKFECISYGYEKLRNTQRRLVKSAVGSQREKLQNKLGMVVKDVEKAGLAVDKIEERIVNYWKSHCNNRVSRQQPIRPKTAGVRFKNT